MKKAQLSLVLLIIIVIIVGVGMAIRHSSKATSQFYIEQLSMDTTADTPLYVYLEQTVEHVFLEGLFLLAAQGGKIYDSTYPDCLEISLSADDVLCDQQGLYPYEYGSYLHEAPFGHKRIAVGINDGRSGQDDLWTYTVRTTYQNFFPMPQPSAYLHFQSAPGTTYYYGHYGDIPSLLGENSIEEQLEQWIKMQLPQRIDRTLLFELGYDLKFGTPQVDVSINQLDLFVDVDYPIIFSDEKTTYALEPVHVEFPYQLRRFYKFIHYMIEQDISSNVNILNLTMVDENGYIISESFRNESHDNTGPNYAYDIITVKDVSYDFTLEHGYEQPYLEFSFIRENRAPDAQTVGGPEHYYYDETNPNNLLEITCWNRQWSDRYLDPDEDEWYSPDFDGTMFNPQWYSFWSAGPVYETHAGLGGLNLDGNPGLCDGTPMKGTTTVLERDAAGGSSFMNLIQTCGNEQLHVEVPTQPSDVGDILVVTVQDDMNYRSTGFCEQPIPGRDGTLVCSGTGRLNDQRQFDPGFVKCNTNRIDGEGRVHPCCNSDTQVWDVGKICPESFGTSLVCSSCRVDDDHDCKQGAFGCDCWDFENCQLCSISVGPGLWEGDHDRSCSVVPRGEECISFEEYPYMCNTEGLCVPSYGPVS